MNRETPESGGYQEIPNSNEQSHYPQGFVRGSVRFLSKALEAASEFKALVTIALVTGVPASWAFHSIFERSSKLYSPTSIGIGVGVGIVTVAAVLIGKEWFNRTHNLRWNDNHIR